MQRLFFPALAALTIVAACDGTNPFMPDGGNGNGTGVLPPGTDDPSASRSIQRYEARNATGGGRAQDVAYDPGTDTFTVDNLAFDGENVYQRGAAVPTLNGYAVFDAAVSTPDFLTGAAVSQIVPYRAVYGTSVNLTASGAPRTSFAIVRTGGYVDYGFGGFVYARQGGVVMPTTGQAVFTGDYAGVRVFQNLGGLEFTTGDMEIDIDFDDFNANNGVSGVVYNRAAYDIAGNPIPLGGAGQLVLPPITFVIQEGEGATFYDTGEFAGNLSSFVVGSGGQLEGYETGKYYAILSGNATSITDGGEIVGVFVVESDDPRYDGVTAQETGGFILYR